MKTVLPAKKPEAFHIDLLRDQVRVIDRRAGDLATARRAFARLNRNIKSLPRGTTDTIADLNKTRESCGHA